jgi:hypothetical protein
VSLFDEFGCACWQGASVPRRAGSHFFAGNNRSWADLMKVSLWIVAVFATIVTLFPATTKADPALSVTFQGVNGVGNNTWLVAVAPDPAFFVPIGPDFGSSLAVELAFAVNGSIIASTTENNVDWMYDNPGMNPFTNTVTFGLWQNAAQDKLFGSFGSRVFLSGDPVELFSFETLGSELTTVDYGVAASGHSVNGATIAQAGQNFVAASVVSDLDTLGILGGGAGIETHYFTGYTGSATSVPEPSALFLVMVGLSWSVFAPRRKRGHF